MYNFSTTIWLVGIIYTVSTQAVCGIWNLTSSFLFWYRRLVIRCWAWRPQTQEDRELRKSGWDGCKFTEWVPRRKSNTATNSHSKTIALMYKQIPHNGNDFWKYACIYRYKGILPCYSIYTKIQTITNRYSWTSIYLKFDYSNFNYSSIRLFEHFSSVLAKIHTLISNLDYTNSRLSERLCLVPPTCVVQIIKVALYLAILCCTMSTVYRKIVVYLVCLNLSKKIYPI